MKQTSQLKSLEACFGRAIADFVFTVPAGYDHDTQLDTFAENTKKLETTSYLDEALTSENFAKATNRFLPGSSYRARIFEMLQTATSNQCLAFLEEHGAILVGAQGITLLQAEMTDQFPVGGWTISLDKKDSLWKDPEDPEAAGIFRRMPLVYRGFDGNWQFHLGYFGFSLTYDSYLLCVSEINP